MSLALPKIGKRVSGIVCLYKPLDLSIVTFRSSFGLKLCDVLNSLDQSEVMGDYNYIEFSETGRRCVDIKRSLESNVLVSGPRFNSENIHLVTTKMGRRMSGVCGINYGISQVLKFQNKNPLMVFHVKGKMGEARVNFYKDDKVVKKANYSRVQKATIDDVTSFMESAYQRSLYKNLGIDLRSQEAYELAVSGKLKCKYQNEPCIYSIKCIDFDPPEFTLEIGASNINEYYLMKLIHDLGLKLRVFAHCTGIRCIRNGQFTVQHSMVKGEWTLTNIYENMALCKKLIHQQESDYKARCSEM